MRPDHNELILLALKELEDLELKVKSKKDKVKYEKLEITFKVILCI